jgi:hypothetical protein
MRKPAGTAYRLKRRALYQRQKDVLANYKAQKSYIRMP